MYLDSMNDQVISTLSAWPFRYYGIRWCNLDLTYKFVEIGESENAEFDITKIYKIL
jgi:hypothetical protein